MQTIVTMNKGNDTFSSVFTEIPTQTLLVCIQQQTFLRFYHFSSMGDGDLQIASIEPQRCPFQAHFWNVYRIQEHSVKNRSRTKSLNSFLLHWFPVLFNYILSLSIPPPSPIIPTVSTVYTEGRLDRRFFLLTT